MPGTAQPRLACGIGWLAGLTVAALACGGNSPPSTSSPPSPERRPLPPVHPLFTTPLAGQTVSVLPLTILIVPDSIATEAPLNERARALLWADSLIDAALEARAPEVKWIPPPALRKIAKRTPGVTTDPDKMGQGIMRVQSLKTTPDPLRTSLRGLVAVAGGRLAMIPAALEFMAEPGGVRAELAMALVDARTGNIDWRTVTNGSGATPAKALNAALEKVLPMVMGSP